MVMTSYGYHLMFERIDPSECIFLLSDDAKRRQRKNINKDKILSDFSSEKLHNKKADAS